MTSEMEAFLAWSARALHLVSRQFLAPLVRFTMQAVWVGLQDC